MAPRIHRGGDPTTLRARCDDPVTIVEAGRVDYELAWHWQQLLAARRADDEVPDVVLLVEHPPTYTLGRRADPTNLLLDDTQVAAAGIEVHRVDRGGDITWHGPGQLVGYPVLQLAGPRVVDHVRALEELNLRMLARHGIRAHRIDGLSGVWTAAGKITAVGVRVLAGRVTQHGWATHVAPALDDFSGIVPCGIDDRPVTSMRDLGVHVPMATVISDSVAALCEVLGTTAVAATPPALDLPLALPPTADPATTARVG